MRILLKILALVAVFFGVFVGDAFAYDFEPLYPGNEGAIKYCLEVEGDVCKKEAANLAAFLDGIDFDWDLEDNFSSVGNGFKFSDVNFEYFLPTYLVEGEIAIAVFKGQIANDNYFDPSDWFLIDSNRNMIPDHLDKTLDLFPDVYDLFYGNNAFYKFEKRWSGQLPVQLDYLGLDSQYGGWSGLLGLYTNQSVLYVDPCTDLKACYGANLQLDFDDIKSTIAHEVFHAIQHAYIGDTFWDFGNLKFYEGMAVAMESKIVSGSESYLYFLDHAPYLTPDDSVFGFMQEHGDEYGSFVWYSFLIERYGADIIDDMLKAYAKHPANGPIYRSYVAMDVALKDRGYSVVDAYLEYVKWNYDKKQYDDGSKFGDVSILDSHSYFPVNEDVINNAPSFFGSNYIEFDMSAYDKSLEVSFTANSDADMYVSFLGINNQGGVYDLSDYNVARGSTKTMEVSNDSGYKKIVMVVSTVAIDYYDLNAFEDYSYPYSYQASLVGGGNYVDSVNDVVPASVTFGNNNVNYGSANFYDVDASNKNYVAINFLFSKGVIKGYDDGSFRPYFVINRAEFLKMLIEGAGITPDPARYNSCFSDVVSDWYAPYVCYAKEKGWVEGYGDGTFKPANEVNKVEALKMLLKVNGVQVPTIVPFNPYSDVASGAWYAPYVVKAKELGILEEEGSVYSPGDSARRAGVAENIYRLISYLEA